MLARLPAGLEAFGPGSRCSFHPYLEEIEAACCGLHGCGLDSCRLPQRLGAPRAQTTWLLRVPELQLLEH